MVEVITVLAILSVLIFLGFIAELIFRKTRIPDVLILIVIGIFISYFFNWINTGQNIVYDIFITFTLVFILFQGALSIDFYTLLKSLKGTFKLTLIGFVLSALAVGGVSYYALGFDTLTSALIGVILGGTCSVVVIPIVNTVSGDKKYTSILSLESAISDVIAIVGAITLISIINGNSIGASEVFKTTITSLLMAGSIGVIIGIFWVLALAKSRLLVENYMVTVAAVVGLYVFVESAFVGASGAIAALTFGLILGNSHSIIHFFASFLEKERREMKESDRMILNEAVLSHSAKNFYAEISFFVKVLFFIYLGTMIDFSNPYIFIYGAIISLSIFVIRPIAVGISFIGEAVDKKSRNLMNILAPRGLASAILAQIALESAIPRAEDIVNIVFGTIFISILLTAILIFINRNRIAFEEDPVKKMQKVLVKEKTAAPLNTKSNLKAVS